MELFIIILVIALIVAAVIFAAGPQLIEAVVTKIDEWAEIIDAFKEEK